MSYPMSSDIDFPPWNAAEEDMTPSELYATIHQMLEFKEYF